ncbi:MAG: hypothetical protein ABI863_06105 [Ginsengibacter sp.]
MNPSPEILNELKAISPLLADLEKINVFGVPEGYFNELHLRIADYALLNNTSAVDNINKRNLQQVPQGYFDTLSDSILAKIKAAYPESAEEELRSFSPMLYALKGENVFSVPNGYFESFVENTVERLKQQPADSESAEEELRGLSPMLYALKGENVFSVPNGYFESFANNTVERVQQLPVATESAEEELHQLSPVLYALKGENVFSVPDGYFESFAGNVLDKVKPQAAKIITMKKRNSWLRYAAAAVITGAIAVSSLQIFNSSDNGKSTLPYDVQASFQYKTQDDLNAGIAKLSDDDIIKYLEKNGNITDNELLTNDIDVSEMPSQADYLNDENTLNTYLDKIDAESADKSKP